MMFLLKRSSFHLSMMAFLFFGMTSFTYAQNDLLDQIRGVDKKEKEDENKQPNKNLETGSTEFTRITDDGVYINCRYWAPKNPSKLTPVVLLMHERGRNQRDWYPLAQLLHANNFAVVTFDFRGHGKSCDVEPTVYRHPEDAEKLEKEKLERLRKGLNVPNPIPRDQLSNDIKDPIKTIDQEEEFQEKGRLLVKYLGKDLEEVKRFMLEKHNQGDFNIKQMGIVCSGMSAAVVSYWMNEFEFVKEGKAGWNNQGNDLASLVIINPIRNYYGFRSPIIPDSETFSDLQILVISNSSRDAFKEAKLYCNKLKVPPFEEAVTKDDGRNNKYRLNSAWLALEMQNDVKGYELFVPEPVERVDEKVERYLTETLLDLEKSRGWEERSLDIDKAGFGSGR